MKSLIFALVALSILVCGAFAVPVANAGSNVHSYTFHSSNTTMFNVRQASISKGSSACVKGCQGLEVSANNGNLKFSFNSDNVEPSKDVVVALNATIANVSGGCSGVVQSFPEELIFAAAIDMEIHWDDYFMIGGPADHHRVTDFSVKNMAVAFDGNNWFVMPGKGSSTCTKNAILTSTSCTLGPKYQKPSMDSTSVWHLVNSNNGQSFLLNHYV